MILAALLLIAPTSQTEWSSTFFLNGNELYTHCKAAKKGVSSEQGICGGYISGVSDAQEAIGTVSRGTHIICVPPQVTIEQEMDIVMKFLEQHPERRHFTASSLVMSALVEEFPCK